jgi:hypothetical protein
MYYKCNNEARSSNHCCSGKEISITYSQWVSVALAIQHAQRMRRIILSSVACPALPYFSTLSHTRHDFRGKIIEHKMCVSIFSTSFVWNVSHSENNSTRYYHKCTSVFMQRTRYFRHILIKLEFSWQISEKYSNTKRHKNPSSGRWFVPCARTDGQTDRQTDRQTDMTEPIVAFRNFAKAPNNTDEKLSYENSRHTAYENSDIL